jgi:hypothetical protein
MILNYVVFDVNVCANIIISQYNGMNFIKNFYCDLITIDILS